MGGLWNVPFTKRGRGTPVVTPHTHLFHLRVIPVVHPHPVFFYFSLLFLLIVFVSFIVSASSSCM